MLHDYIKDIGMVLSGGGAKGAHQIGFFKAFEEWGLWGALTAVSGCSIGAINALLAAKRDFHTQQAAWEKLSLDALACPGEGAVPGPPSDYYPDRERKYASMTPQQYLKAASPFPYTQDGLGEVMKEYASLDDDAPKLYSCAYDMENLVPQYFYLNNRSPEEVLQLVKASCNIPILLPPVEFEGKLYCDGGLVPPYFSGEKNSDKIPLLPLAQMDLGLIIVMYLSPYDALDFDCLPPDLPVLEVYPSRPLEKAIGSGTLDFSPEVKEENIQLGYQDGRALLMQLEQLLEGGNSPVEATCQLNRASQCQRLALLEKIKHSR